MDLVIAAAGIIRPEMYDYPTNPLPTHELNSIVSNLPYIKQIMMNDHYFVDMLYWLHFLRLVTFVIQDCGQSGIHCGQWLNTQ